MGVNNNDDDDDSDRDNDNNDDNGASWRHCKDRLRQILCDYLKFCSIFVFIFLIHLISYVILSCYSLHLSLFMSLFSLSFSNKHDNI